MSLTIAKDRRHTCCGDGGPSTGAGRTNEDGMAAAARTDESPRTCTRESAAVFHFKGRVVRGSGRASFFTSLEWVKDKCKEEFGFTPYPGTLNVKLTPELQGIVKEIRRHSPVVFCPPRGSAFYPARACRVVVNGVRGIIVFPATQVNIHDSDTVEIMSDICLREALGVREGDEVSVEVKDGFLTEKG
ncbi:MAG TPA: DUF120 domain-containing protein [Clostridia bacterium]|nr:DUF120 domain-containing protein [Clostridia bacterium]